MKGKWHWGSSIAQPGNRAWSCVAPTTRSPSFWKGNERLVFLADFQGNESFFIGSTDLSGKNVIRIAETQPGEYLQGSMGGVIDALRGRPDQIVVTGYFMPPKDSTGGSSTGSGWVIARLNVRNRGLSPLYTYAETDRIPRVQVDNSGVLRLRGRIEAGKALVWEHRSADNAAWVTLGTPSVPRLRGDVGAEAVRS
jgi:hypothetical protein